MGRLLFYMFFVGPLEAMAVMSHNALVNLIITNIFLAPVFLVMTIAGKVFGDD